MKRRALLAGAMIGLLAAACGGSKQAAAPAAKRYERKPITEVTQAELDNDSRLIDALTLQATGRNAEAAKAYAALVADNPQCAAAWYELGRMMGAQGWTDSALHCARRAYSLAGGNRWYGLGLAEAATRAGDHRTAAATWEALVRDHPETLEYYYELSNAYISLGDLGAAVEALNRVERRIGVSEPISLQKQRLWEAAGKEEKALRELEALAAAMPHEKKYSAVLAQTYMKQRRLDKAKQCYDRILAADPDDEYIHIQLAEYYRQGGQPGRADEEMALAMKNPRLDVPSKMQLLASFYPTDSRWSERGSAPARMADSVMARNNANGVHAQFYGEVLLRQERYAEAADWFTFALAADSGRYEVWEGLIISLLSVGDRQEELRSYAARAEALFPLHTLPHYVTAVEALTDKRYDEAAKHIEEAIRWGFRQGYLEAECYGVAAEARYRTGDHEGAWKAFDRYLQLRPDDWGMMNNYAYYLSEQRQRLDDALQMSRRTIEAEPDNANSLDTYAWILHLLGRDAEALPHMRRAVELDPASETLNRHLKTIEEAAR